MAQITYSRAKFSIIFLLPHLPSPRASPRSATGPMPISPKVPSKPVADPRGARDAPSLGLFYFQFHAVLGGNYHNNRLGAPSSRLASPIWEIMDLPLLTITLQGFLCLCETADDPNSWLTDFVNFLQFG